MRLSIGGRAIAYDDIGPENAPVICMTHSLSSDSGMWAEQVPPLLAAGFRVLRIDMRGHGGSDPVAGNYTMTEIAGAKHFPNVERDFAFNRIMVDWFQAQRARV